MDMMGDNPFKKEHYFNGVVCTVSTNAVLSKFEARLFRLLVMLVESTFA